MAWEDQFKKENTTISSFMKYLKEISKKLESEVRISGHMAVE